MRAQANRARTRPAEPRRRRGLEALTLIAAIVGSLLAAELGLRMADRFGWTNIWADLREPRTASIWMASEDPELIYQHRPGYMKDGVRHTERHGILRPIDVSERPNADTTRIVLLGDSVAASIDLPYEQRFSTLLEDALSRRGDADRPSEVLNFAVNGCSTAQEARLLEVSAGNFEPDLLMLQFCMNDFRPMRFPTRWFEPHPGSYLLTATKFLFDRKLLDGYPEAAYWENAFQTDRAGLESIEDGFDRIARYAVDRRVPVLFVIFPLLSHEGWYAGDAERRHSLVRGLAHSHGFEVLDLLPILAAHPADSLRVNPWDTYHLNVQGHRLAATAIENPVRELVEQNGAPR